MHLASARALKLLAANKPPPRSGPRGARIRSSTWGFDSFRASYSPKPSLQAAILANSICGHAGPEAPMCLIKKVSMEKFFGFYIQTTLQWSIVSAHCIVTQYLSAPQENNATFTSDQARPLFCAFSRRQRANLTGSERTCALPAGRAPSYASCAESSPQPSKHGHKKFVGWLCGHVARARGPVKSKIAGRSSTAWDHAKACGIRREGAVGAKPAHSHCFLCLICHQ